MIWGAEEKSKMNLFFLRECLLKIIFSWKRPFEFFFPGRPLNFFFSWRWLRNFFSVYKPIKKVPNFSWGRPSEIYLFLRKGLRFFFLDFLGPHPQIINGRPLRLSSHHSLSCLSFEVLLWLSVFKKTAMARRKWLRTDSQD